MTKPSVTAIFPTAIYQNDVQGFQQLISDNIQPYWFSEDEGIQGEYLGKADMQINPNLRPFYERVADEIRTYLEVIGVDNELFDLYFVKSCLSKISTQKDHMVAHQHYCSHISFVYYHSVPENADCLFFHNHHKPNELFGNMINHERDRSFLVETNPFNASQFYIEPKEEMLVIFPSKLPHSTGPVTGRPLMSEGNRVAIVGDVHLVLKPGQDNWETGLVSLDKWSRF